MQHAYQPQMQAGAHWLLPEVNRHGKSFATSGLVETRLTDTLYLKVEGKVLKLTHADKVLYPALGWTKKQVLGYYRKIAPYLLPYLSERAITLKRYPDGTGADFFYEKHAPGHRPEWIRTVLKKDVNYVLIDSLPSLLWAANLASLEFHPYLSRIKNFSEPSSLVFDLDPGMGTNVIDCAKVGLLIHELFEKAKLKSFVKSSGSKGLQIYVPLNSRTNFSETKACAQGIAQKLESLHPELITSKMAKALRTGKILIDWSQNDENKTTVAVYSLRGTPSPFVSAPLQWSELKTALRTGSVSSLFVTPDQVFRRLERLGDLFLPTLKLKQRLPHELTHLDEGIPYDLKKTKQ